MKKHLVVKYKNCNQIIIDTPARLERILKTVADKCGLTSLGSVSHRFAPQGVTAVLITAESHIRISTWPETGEAYVDFFSCKPKTNFMLAVKVIAKEIKSTQCDVAIMDRDHHKILDRFSLSVIEECTAEELI